MVDDGVYIDDVKLTRLMSCTYTNSITSIANSCNIVIDNSGGAGIGAVDYFKDIKIYKSNVILWRGEVYDITPKNNNQVEIIGLGHMRRLMSRFHSGTFTTQSRSAIVESLVDDYGEIITTVSGITATSESITRLYKAISVFDAILDLANELNFDVWIDTALEFFFVERGTTHSGLTISYTGGHVISADAPAAGRDCFNRVIVFGNPDAVGGQPVVQVDDMASQLTYNMIKEHEVVADPTLATEQECYDRGQQIILGQSDVVPSPTIQVFGYESLLPGQTVILSGFSTVFNCPDDLYIVLEHKGDFNAGTQILTLAQYGTATQDAIADLIKRMRKREYEMMDESVVATQFLSFYETLEIEGYVLTVKRVTIGNSFITGHPTSGIGGITANNIKTGLQGRTIRVDISESET